MNKSVALLLVLVFLTAFCTVSVMPAFQEAVPPVKAQTQVGTSVFISVEPNPAETGQLVRVTFRVEPAPPTPTDIFRNLTFYYGTTKLGSHDTNPDGSVMFNVGAVTGSAGVKTLGASFPGQSFDNGVVYYLPSENQTTLTMNPPPPPPPPPGSTVGNWTRKASMKAARSYLGVAVVNGKIYVIGGDSNKTINQVYDPATDSWTTKASMPTGAWGYASAVFDNKIYIFLSYLNAIYDVENDKWSIGASLPSPSAVMSAKAGATTGVNASKQIYVLSASGFDTDTARTQFNLVYDPDYDRWMYEANFTTFRTDFGVAVVNDMLYVIGGFTIKGIHAPIEQTWYATNEEYTPFGYGTPDPSYVPPDITAPEIAVLSPENKTYYTSDVALNFTVNEPVSSMRYMLDGETVGEISGNTTLAGLAYGGHNVTLYAVDRAGNMGASETISFIIAEEPEPFPTELAIIASGASVVAVGVVLLVYFKKRKR